MKRCNIKYEYIKSQQSECPFERSGKIYIAFESKLFFNQSFYGLSFHYRNLTPKPITDSSTNIALIFRNVPNYKPNPKPMQIPWPHPRVQNAQFSRHTQQHNDCQLSAGVFAAAARLRVRSW